MDENNKELNISNNSIDSNSVNTEVVVVNNENIVTNTNISSEALNNGTRDVSVSASANTNNIGVEEVSVSGTSLDEVETSSNSVFNEKSEEVVSASMKEGQEHRAEKKGFPYGMVIGFALLIVCAFFIDNIVGFVEDYLLPKNEVVEDNKKDDKETDTKEEVKEEDKD